MKRLYLIQKKAQMPERKLIITRIPVLPRLPADPDAIDLEIARNVKGFYLVQDSRHRIEQKVQAYLFREVSTRIIVTHVRLLHQDQKKRYLNFIHEHLILTMKQKTDGK